MLARVEAGSRGVRLLRRSLEESSQGHSRPGPGPCNGEVAQTEPNEGCGTRTRGEKSRRQLSLSSQPLAPKRNDLARTDAQLAQGQGEGTHPRRITSASCSRRCSDHCHRDGRCATLALLCPSSRSSLARAGSGKTTFMQRVNSYLHSRNQPPYILNLDPAVTHMPFTANIDIRDTVDYQEVMKQCVQGRSGVCQNEGLSGMGAGTTSDRTAASSPRSTSSRQSSTRSSPTSKSAPQPSSASVPPSFFFDHARRADAGGSSYILVDTPGQIEIFTWSASGAIITDALASAVPTVIAYIIDTPRTSSPATFMSNMLYACSCASPRLRELRSSC